MNTVIPQHVANGRFVLTERCIYNHDNIVYEAYDVCSPLMTAVAVKLTPEYEFADLQHELSILDKIKGFTGFTNILYCDVEQGYGVTVMELLGPSLEERQSQKRFHTSEALQIAHYILLRLETLHSNGILHGNLTPTHVLLEDEYHLNVHLINFSQSVDLHQKITDFHRNMNAFSSISAHLNRIPSRKDDLESCGFILLYLINRLPWCNIDKDEMNKMKFNISIDELCHNLHPSFSTYLHYVRGLSEQTVPDYHFLRGLFQKTAEDCHHHIEHINRDNISVPRLSMSMGSTALLAQFGKEEQGEQQQQDRWLISVNNELSKTTSLLSPKKGIINTQLNKIERIPIAERSNNTINKQKQQQKKHTTITSTYNNSNNIFSDEVLQGKGYQKQEQKMKIKTTTMKSKLTQQPENVQFEHKPIFSPTNTSVSIWDNSYRNTRQDMVFHNHTRQSQQSQQQRPSTSNYTKKAKPKVKLDLFTTEEKKQERPQSANVMLLGKYNNMARVTPKRRKKVVTTTSVVPKKNTVNNNDTQEMPPPQAVVPIRPMSALKKASSSKKDRKNISVRFDNVDQVKTFDKDIM